jgi:hypothetical protein
VRRERNGGRVGDAQRLLVSYIHLQSTSMEHSKREKEEQKDA